MSSIVSIDGYSIRYDKMRNQIVISLPQTMETITDTVGQIATHRVDISDAELGMLLQLVKYMLEVKL